MKIHELKTWPEYFNLMVSGEKTFELREDDRDFKVGDRLDLMEFDPSNGEYTGRHIHRFITHILQDNPFINLGNNVLLSIAIYPKKSKAFTSYKLNLRSDEIELLIEYTNWLLGAGYVDTDVYSEEPTAIDMFMELRDKL
jgi:hypothetical protein